MSLETEKVALVSPRSPGLSSSIPNTIQRQTRRPSGQIQHNSSDDNEISLFSPRQLRSCQFNISSIPINRHQSLSCLTSTRLGHTKKNIENINNGYFSPSQIVSSSNSVDFRPIFHGIYVLPVSPALSTSSTTTNTEETVQTGSYVMPILSRKDSSSSTNIQKNSVSYGVQNESFTDSPKPKDRILSRSRASTVYHIQPFPQLPPLPPTISQLHVINKDKSSFQQHSTETVWKPNAISPNCSTTNENEMKKASLPPVPCRLQKPSIVPPELNGFTDEVYEISFPLVAESSPQDNCFDNTWPKPPESVTTSEISGPLSIPYDHLIPTVLMHQNGTTNIVHQLQHDEHSILTASAI